MKYFFVKMRRDLINKWNQFATVFLMALLGVLIYSGMEGTWFGMQTVMNQYFQKTNLASAWVYGANITPDDLQKIKALSNVDNCTYSATDTVKTQEASKSDTDIKLTEVYDNSISKPYQVSGEAFNLTENGVWLDKDYAEANNKKVGDSINIQYGNSVKSIEVKGLIYSPEYIYYTGSSTAFMPDHKKYGYGFINLVAAETVFTNVEPNEIRVILKKDSTSDLQTFEKNVQSILGSRYQGFADRDNLEGVSNPLQQVDEFKSMSIMFSAMFILLALLTMQSTMNRLVDIQRIQIGTLKALGFKKAQIQMHYALYGLSVGLIGGLIGLIVAPFTITPVLLLIQQKTFSLPEWEGRLTPVSYGIVLIISLCCTLASVLSCRQGLKGMPAETMRGKLIRAEKKALIERFSILWNKLSYAWRWPLRCMSRNKVRTAISIISVIGCMTLLVASFGMQDSQSFLNHYIFKMQYKYGEKAVFSMFATQDEKNNAYKLSGGGQFVEETSVEFEKAKDNNPRVLTVVGSGDFIKYEDSQGKPVTLPKDGVLLTSKTAQYLNLKKGDMVKFKLAQDTKYMSAKINGIVDTPSPQGIFVSENELKKLGKDFDVTSILLPANANIDKIKNLSYINDVVTLESQFDSAQEFSKTFGMIFLLMKAAAILLALIILYNLGILNYTERLKEYATLKVLGFYQKEIRTLSIRENITTTIIGWIISIPISFWFLGAYVNVVSDYSVDERPKITLLSFLFSTLITFGCSFVVSLYISYKVKRVNMTETLKSFE